MCGAEAIHAVKTKAKTAHYLTVETHHRSRLYRDANATKTIDRRAVASILPGRNLCGTDTAGIDARWCVILNAPVSTAQIGHVVESSRRPGNQQTQKSSRHRQSHNSRASLCRHGRHYKTSFLTPRSVGFITTYDFDQIAFPNACSTDDLLSVH